MSTLTIGTCYQGSRTLMPGEIALATKMFATSIDYSKVLIHEGKYTSLQKDKVAITPDNRIFMPSPIYSNDYSSGTAATQALFIHELVHIWQYQSGLYDPVTAAAAEYIRNFSDYDRAYDYTLEEGRDLLSYRFEQQAAIIEDYFRVQYAGVKPRKNPNGHFNMQNNLPLSVTANALRRVLLQFMANPSYAKNPLVCKRQKSPRPTFSCTADSK